MFTIFNSESLWIGTDLKRFNESRDKLKAAKIPYKHKVKNRLSQWADRGTLRGNIGSFGNPSVQMYQHEILVYQRDREKAEIC